MMWDAHAKTHIKPLADERERAMGFRTGTTTTRSLFEGQCRFVLGQIIESSGDRMKMTFLGVDQDRNDQLHHWIFLPYSLKNAHVEFQRVKDQVSLACPLLGVTLIM